MASLESPLPANLTSSHKQHSLAAFLKTYFKAQKRSVVIWWMIHSLPNVIFAIQLAVMESNQRHSHKEKAERFHVLNLKVIHKFNFYFSLALNLGMVINYVYSFLSHDFAKTIMELVSFIHLGCNKCRLAKGFLFTFFFFIAFQPSAFYQLQACWT